MDLQGPDLLMVGNYALGVEVGVADTDALFGDACDVLRTGSLSPLLRAIRVGTVRLVMSQRAFHELGWVSAMVARSRGVLDADLRAVLTREYLPRIPVVVVPPVGSGVWMPDADDVRDPHDVEHVQVARLISARTVYSHDRHLRTPGFAPASRAEYEARIGHLTALASQRETEQGLSLLAAALGSGTSHVLSQTSVRLNMRPGVMWSSLAAMVAGSLYLALAPAQRRARFFEALMPALDRVGAALERGAHARYALSSTSLIVTDDADRVEAMVGTYLARNPDSTMSEISEALNLDIAHRQQLSTVLRCHPSFELISRYGWAVGRTRERLETFPPKRRPLQ